MEALKRAELIDELLASLEQPDKAIDALWAEEAKGRIDAYDRGEIESVSVQKVMARYKKK